LGLSSVSPPVSCGRVPDAEVDRCRPELAFEDEGADTRGTGTGLGGVRDTAAGAVTADRIRAAAAAAPAARSAEGSGALNMFARLGFVARGIVCIVIGAVALMVAFGVARYEPDRAGAIEAIAAKPFGYLLLWILVIGFLGMAVRRFVQAAVRRLN
jgi:hypothetical protein